MSPTSPHHMLLVTLALQVPWSAVLSIGASGDTFFTVCPPPKARRVLHCRQARSRPIAEMHAMPNRLRG